MQIVKIRLLLLAILFLSAVASNSGQSIHSFLRPVGSLADIRSGTFSSTEAGFSIDLPKNNGGFDGTKGIQYSWRLNEGYFFVGMEERGYEVENSDRFEDETVSVADSLLNDIRRGLFSSKYEILNVQKQENRYLSHRSFEFKIQMTDTIAVIRVFWNKNRAYKLGLLLTKEQMHFEDRALQVFETLKLHSKSSLDDLVAQKVKEHTPKPLPQSSRTIRPSTDALDENLKGKVKTIFEEVQFISGDKKGRPKRLDKEYYFDQVGNLTKYVDYDDTTGLPFQIKVFGYIDRKRVSRTGTIFYGNELRGIAMVGPPGRQKRRDNRFDNQYRYKYDRSGRLIEKTVFDNAGAIWTKSVFKYLDDSVETSVYDQAGAVNMRSTTKLDDKGNRVLSTYYNSPVAGWDSIYSIEYLEFDKEGNWLKQNLTLSRRFQGILKEEWTMTKVRKITYY